MITALASAGVFVAVPITGAIALGRGPVNEGRAGRIPLLFAVGLTLWSVPLLGSLMLRAYRPEVIGILGWVVVLAWLVLRRPRIPRFARPQLHAVVLAIGLAAAGVVVAAAPTDPLAGGRDMAVYTNHAIYMAHHGRLDIPYPAGVDPNEPLPQGWVGFSGVYTTQPTLTVQFGHVFPAWLAQTYAVAGYGGLLRVNAVFAVLSGLAVFAVARRWMPGHVAVLAALFLAFSAGQVWVARNTLTETLTQLLIWTAFLLLVSRRQERPRASAGWAGVLLGMSTLVRIDSLVILPLVMVGHVLTRLVGGRDAQELRISTFYQAAVPAFALAIGYYLGFSRPYFMAHSSLILPIMGASVAAAALAGMSRLPALWSRAATTVRQPRFLGFAVVVVVLLALYAYFMRPTAQPFARLPIDPLRPWLVPGRSYVEEALPNLGQYLSLPVLWMAVGAWLATSVTAVLRRTLRPLPVLVVIGGFSALYFWNQAITPDHFWAIRRFVPIILPAAVVFAGVAGAFALSFLPVRWRPLLFGLAVLALALQTWRAGWPMFFVAERAGTYEALQRFATELPSGVTFMGPLDRIGMHRSGTALFMSFDTDVLPIAFDGETGREEIISRLRRASIERPIAIISSPDDPALDGEPMARIHHEFTLMAQTLRPVPQAVIDGELNLVARWVAGASTLDLEVGSRSHWLVQERGFFSPDTVRDHQARWTNGDAELTIPIFDGAEPERLVVELDWTGPKGALLNVTFGGIQLALVDLPDGDWTATFDLPRDAVDDREEVIVGLRSSTFVPANALEGSQDTRHLGVMVRSIRLLGPDS